jgi:hypothetical protein
MADKSLSTYGHNVKIVAVKGQVTLNGAVRSDVEGPGCVAGRGWRDLDDPPPRSLAPERVVHGAQLIVRVSQDGNAFLLSQAQDGEGARRSTSREVEFLVL